MTVLDTILDDKRREVTESKRSLGNVQIEKIARDAAPPRPFKKSLAQVHFALIAEIKKASPSRGTLLKDFDHRKLAIDFQSGGASALSVLTDRKYFGGDASFIREVKEAVDLPVLRKDFILDEYQVYESRAIGADAILLIVRALPPADLERLYVLAASLGMGILVETHSQGEIEVANSIGADIIGVNNRDLDTFKVSIKTSVDLCSHIGKRAIAVSESGITSRRDVLTLQSAGFKAVLVGEGLVTREDRTSAVRELITG